jgi:glycosyltransferase involved in cell wall biosynthesis
VKLSVLMPVYNERGTIEEIVRRVRAVPIPKEIVIVDDASTDGTVERLKVLEGDDVRVFRHQVNRGKGAAVRTALENATGDIILIQDADLEYDPADYPRLLEPIVDGRADVVFGSRFLGGGEHRVHLFWHYAGNRLLTTLSNMLTNLNLTDMESGFKVFRADVGRGLNLRENRFGFEPEFTAKIARRRCRVYEVPISYSGRDYSEGKKITWRDGILAFWQILRYSLGD